MYDDKELRAFISHDIYRQIDHFTRCWNVYNDDINRAKNWCITLFMVAVGFCLKEMDNLPRLLFYLLPYLPLSWFGIYTAYQRLMADITTGKKVNEEWRSTLSNLYSFTEKELLEKVKEIQEWKPSHPDKGKLKWGRFFKEKIPGMIKSFSHLEYFVFFGYGLLLWLIVALILKPPC